MFGLSAHSDQYAQTVDVQFYAGVKSVAHGTRQEEVALLIDSASMMVHIHQGKGNRDRDVPISEKLLETLREYFRWMKPKTHSHAYHRTSVSYGCA